MILKKDFYFVRHGQTDHNIGKGNLKVDHPEDIALNDTGRNQAQNIEPIIAALPIRTVCSSPMKRVQETKSIITPKLQADHFTINHFTECSAKIWHEMVTYGMFNPLPSEGDVRLFMDRIREGINQALALPSPTLIVAHGGTHWALCCMLGITTHNWSISNCEVVHFSCEPQGWTARKL